MATYYVSTTGNTGNTGTALSPWTIGKALGSGSTVAAGDTVYIEPGIYPGSTTMVVSGTSGNPVTIIGDVDGAGFRSGGAPSPLVGTVHLTGYTDFQAGTGVGGPLKGSTTSLTYITLRNLYLTANSGNFGLLALVSGTSTTSFRGWTIQDCVFQMGHDATSGVACINVKHAADTRLDWTIERCTFHSAMVPGSQGLINFQIFYSVNGEQDLGVVIRNCNFIGGDFAVNLAMVANGGNLYKPYGITINGCTMIHQSRIGVCLYQGGATITGNTTSLGGSNTNYVYNCAIMAPNYGIACGHATQCYEDGNYIIGGRSNATVGGASRTAGAPLFNPGLERILGLPPRPMFEPLPIPTSPLIGFANVGSPPSTDLFNRNRPEGLGSIYPTPGAMEVHDNGVRNATYADGGTGYCLQLGPGAMSQERYLLVNATATSITVKVRWDGNHGDTNKPQAILIANPEIGITSGQTVTATTSYSTGSGTSTVPGNYETLTFSSITPTAAGVLILRLVSRPAAATGNAYFDTITLS